MEKIKIEFQGRFEVVIDCGYDFALMSLIKKKLRVILPPGQYNSFSKFKNANLLKLYRDCSDVDSNRAKIVIKRGHLNRLLPFIDWPFKPENIALERFSPALQVPERDYQRKSVEAWLGQKFGIIKVPTRGGKTFISAEIIKFLSESEPDSKHIFIVDTTDLYTQTIEEFAKIFPEEIGEIQGDFFKPERITVAMAQTLQSRLKKEILRPKRQRMLTDFLTKISYVFIDECHDFSSKSRLDIIRRNLKTNFICGLSGTPEKSNNIKDNLAMQGLLGGIVYEITEKQLEERGVISISKVLIVEHDMMEIDIDLDYNEFIEDYVFKNKKRNLLITQIMEVAIELNLKLLVMTNSKKHASILQQQFLCNENVSYINGDDKKFDRREVKNKFVDSGAGHVVIVTDIWKKGITLPQAELLLNITVGSEESNVIQKRGRILGSTENKNRAMTIDIADICEHWIGDHSYARIKAYEKFTGVENLIAISGSGDFKNNLKSLLKNWFYGDSK